MMRRLVLTLAIMFGLLQSVLAQSTLPLKLTLQDAIECGLKANLSVLVADSRVAEARGTAERRSSALYPRVRIDTPVTVQTRNLAAQGISFQGVPEVVGPFSTYDFRATTDQQIIDLSALESFGNRDDSEWQQPINRLLISPHYIRSGSKTANESRSERLPGCSGSGDSQRGFFVSVRGVSSGAGKRGGFQG
jgi:hypothetical protein